jgi:nitrate reductase NapE component
VTSGRRSGAWCRATAACVVASLLLASGCRTVLPRQYEYDEQFDVALDGSATAYVNASVPALVALRGIDLDTTPSARLDRTALRQFFSGNGVRVIRISASRRHGRRFVHLRLDVDDVRKLNESRAFSWATVSLSHQGNQYVYIHRIGPAAGREVGNVGWDGSELVAFRLHLPARIRYHNAPSHRVERGNILEWEQPLADRMKGAPIRMEARMDQESILYTTLTLFAVMAVLVVATFALIIWMVVKKGRSQSRKV